MASAYAMMVLLSSSNGSQCCDQLDSVIQGRYKQSSSDTQKQSKVPTPAVCTHSVAFCVHGFVWLEAGSCKWRPCRACV